MRRDGTIYTTDGTPVFAEWQGVIEPLRHAIFQLKRDFTEDRLEYEHKLLTRVRFEFQGGLVRCYANKLSRRRKPSEKPRGLVLDFSRRSRVNLMEQFARINWTDHKAIFITLTYHNEIPHERDAKKHLRAFLKRLWRACGARGVVWRMEHQPKRNAVHFHLIVFDLPYIHWSQILEEWREVTGDMTITQTRISLLDSPSKARRYLCKYLAKVAQPIPPEVAADSESPGDGVPVSGILDTLPYLAEPPAQVSPGRVWGVEQKALIPLAPLTAVVFDNGLRLLYSMKRAMRKVFAGTNKHRGCGARLFTVSSQRWLEWLEFEIVSSID